MSTKKYILSVESCLDWDDSEQAYNVLGSFTTEDELIELLESFWFYSYQEELTEPVVKGILESIDEQDEEGEWGRFTIVEPEDIVDSGSYATRFTFQLTFD